MPPISVAADKTKVKAEPLELLDFSPSSGSSDQSVDIPTISPESSPPKLDKKESYRPSKPFECGVVVKTEPLEEPDKRVRMVCFFKCLCVCLFVLNQTHCTICFVYFCCFPT